MSERRSFFAEALDPDADVVVEACAGSGKTWLLVSRLIRLLLAGVRPGDILAISFTRKAAREIEERLRLWLRQLATAPDPEIVGFLVARGLDEGRAAGLAETARGLYERLLNADPPLTVTTFHGWFARILQGSPLDCGWTGFELAESAGRLQEEAWARFARHCGAAPEGPEARALRGLFEELGLSGTRRLLGAFIERRAEWLAWCAAIGGEAPLEASLARLAALLQAGEPGTALARFAQQPGLEGEVAEFAALLGLGSPTEQRQGDSLADWAGLPEPAERLARLRAAVLTAKGEPRACKLTDANVKRRGQRGAERLVELHRALCEQVADVIDALEEERQLRVNRDAQRAGEALRRALEALKRARRKLDFNDLEWQVDRLLADESRAAFALARLDARYRHILLDEFQDTNPLQWRILCSWLAAYGDDRQRPRLFLVGDPKQSIYRFRRADYRIFGQAAGWLESHFQARLLANDLTRRNAPAVIEVVNAMFAAEADFSGFRAHHAQRAGLPGRVELLPLIQAEASEAREDPERNPLHAPREVLEDLRRRREALALVGRLGELIGRVAVRDGERSRPAEWGDVLLLARRRRVMPEFERALREAGVPYLSVSRGGLLRTLEARDLAALLRFLVTPSDDLALAHTLRTPLFAVEDQELMRLALRSEANWWERLKAVPAGQSPALAAAAGRLERWLGLAAALPVHDLLDRIYHEGAVLARYRGSLPAAMWPGVRANLEAFLELALEVDGGRYPSLTRFVDELARRARPDDEDAPDEGVVAGGEAGAGRLRLMTVHAAKGLEAPLVWLMDASAEREPPDGYQPLLAWPPQAAAPEHFSLYTTPAQLGRHRAEIFAEEQAAARRERLNLLYVAITRAEQYFFASGIDGVGRRGGDHARLGAALAALGGEGTLAWGDFEPAPAEPPRPQASAREAGPALAVPAVGERCPPVEGAAAATEFGLALHAWLEAASQPGAIVPDCAEAVRQAGERILARPELQRFFDPRSFSRARNEQSFVRRDGSVGRIDRLVWQPDGLWILDYKSGAPNLAAAALQRAQLEDYRAVLASIHPGQPIHCVLIFGDGTHRVF